MARRLLTVALLAACSFFVFSTAASAKTLCVDQSPPAIPAGCDSSFAYSAAGLQGAVNYANSVTDYPGEDTVRIAPGTLVLDTNVNVMMQATFGATHIVGAGRGVTTLQLTHDSTHLTGLSFDAREQPSSSISDLSIDIPVQLGSRVGMSTQGGTITRTRFTVVADSESIHRGLLTSGTIPTTVTDTDFVLNGHAAGGEITAIVADSSLVASGLTITATSSILAGQRGIVSTRDGSSVMIDASRFENLDPALRVERGTVKVLDSLLLNPLGDIDTAIQFASTGATDAALITSGVTVVGARTGVDISTATPSPNIDINNSIIQTAGTGAADVACAGSPGFVPDLTVRVSILSLGATPPSCNFTEIETINRATNPPVFAGPGDYRPALGSPQIDAGEVIYPTMMGDPSPLVDLAGAARLVDGNGDGAAKLDIGAYEYQQPLTVTPIAGLNPTTTTLTLSFGKVVGKFKVKKKAPKTFTFTTAKKKPRLPVTSNLATPVELTLARSKAGYVSGKKCAKKKPTTSGKKKRCDIPLKGKLALKLPAGTSYLSFSGKWNKKKLKPGKYTLFLTATGLKDARKAILSVVR